MYTYMYISVYFTDSRLNCVNTFCYYSLQKNGLIVKFNDTENAIYL